MSGEYEDDAAAPAPPPPASAPTPPERTSGQEPSPTWRFTDGQGAGIASMVAAEGGNSWVVAAPDPSRKLLRTFQEAGVRDLFDLFDTEGRPTQLAEYAMVQFPAEFAKLTARFLMESARQIEGEMRDALDRLPGPRDIHPEDVSLILSLIRKGYRLDGETATDFYVPVYCAHPIGDPRIPVVAAVADATSVEVGFEIDVAGVSGGFGDVTEIGIELAFDPSEHSVQYQQRMSGLVRQWRRASGHEITTMSVRRAPGVRLTSSDRDSYIRYSNLSAKQELEIREPLVMDATPVVEHTYQVQRGFSDKFKIPLAPMGLAGSLNVESTSKSTFSIAHDLIAPYEYRFFGISRSCHDVFVAARKL